MNRQRCREIRPDGSALHNLGRKYEIGPIDPVHFAEWIEAQFRLMGIDGAGLGGRIIEGHEYRSQIGAPNRSSSACRSGCVPTVSGEPLTHHSGVDAPSSVYR